MKVYIFYTAKDSITEIQIDDFDLDILPPIGAKIKVHDDDGIFTDCLVEELRWDVTSKNDPHVQLVARQI